MSTQAPVPTLVPAFDAIVSLGELQDHGPTRAGHRRIIPVTGGSLRGDVEAEILPGGADWQIMRTDGALEIDGRYSARTRSGDLVHLRVSGVRSGSPAVLASLLAGAEVPPAEYYFRTSVSIETSAPRLEHLQHSLFVASCVRRAATVEYRAYRVT